MALSTDYTWTWEVTGLKKQDQVNSEGANLAGAVVQTYWKVTGVDSNGNEGDFAGATPFNATNVPAGSFVAFESLTEETVLGWIQNVVNSDQGYADHISERVALQINEATVEEASMPWAPEEEVVDPSVEAAAPDEGESDPEPAAE